MSKKHTNFIHPYTNLEAHQTRGPMIINKGEGVHVWDDKGKKYLEAFSALWCSNLGFSNKRLEDAMTDQVKQLPYYHSFTHKGVDVSLELAERLLATTHIPMESVSFCNSGSEANDTAVKIVWYYNNIKGRAKKKKIIARDKAYHGVTVAAASLTGLPHLHRDFDLPLERISHVAPAPHYYRYAKEGESEAEFSTRLAKILEDKIIAEGGAEEVAAFIAEPIMGAGGVMFPPETYFEKIQAVLKKYDVLLIADEVVCGFGRTGNFWGSETYNMKPDIICSAKGLTNAYIPMAAVMMNKDIYDTVAKGSNKHGLFGHGYTYTAHPIAAAVALENIKIYEEEGIIEKANKIAPLMHEGLKEFADHPLVGEIDGIGMVAVTELVADKENKTPFAETDKIGYQFFERMQDKGVIIRAMGDRIGFCPSLIFNENHMEQMLTTYGTVLEEMLTHLNKKGLIAA